MVGFDRRAIADGMLVVSGAFAHADDTAHGARP
jgi:hypothetical protein